MWIQPEASGKGTRGRSGKHASRDSPVTASSRGPENPQAGWPTLPSPTTARQGLRLAPGSPLGAELSVLYN